MKRVISMLLLVFVGLALLAGNTENSEAIQVIEIEAFDYAAINMTGSYDQHASVFEQLYQAAGMQQLPMDAPPFGIYRNSPSDVPEDSLIWEVGLMIPADTEVDSPLVRKTWSFSPLAQLHYEGAFSEEAMGAAYGKIFMWIAENGYQPAGPMMEKYLGPPATDENGEMSGKIDILVPVMKAE